MATKRAKKPVFISGISKSQSQYLKELEELLKKKKEGSTLFGEDTGDNPGFIVPGRYFRPGLRQAISPDEQQPTERIPSMVFDAPQFEQFKERSYQGQRPEDIQKPRDTRVKTGSVGVGTTSEQLDAAKQLTGSEYPVQQMRDGGILYSDNRIRYEDGTIRDFTGTDAQPISSQADGSILYSDGSSRRQMTTTEGFVQGQDQPVGLQSLGGNRVLYSDGIVREGTYQTPAQRAETQQNQGSGVVNFFDKFGQGYQFRESDGAAGLGGQCAWFSEQITRMPDGSTWTIGSTIQDKRNQFAGHANKGNAYYLGQGQPQVGQSIVQDLGTDWGHVATISEILPDGSLRLTESNYAGPRVVTHDRIISANDPSIIGFLKTQPVQGYTTKDWREAPPISGERELAVTDNASSTGQQDSTIRSEKEQIASLPPIASDQSGGAFPEAMTPVQQQVQGEAREQMSSQSEAQPLPEGSTPLPMRMMGQAIEQAQPTGELGLGISETLRGDIPEARQEVGQTVGALGQAVKAPEMYASEAISGELTPGQALSKSIEENVPKSRIDTGISELARGDIEGAKRNFQDTVSRISNRVSNIPSQLGREVVPQVSADDGQPRQARETLKDNFDYMGKSVSDKFGEQGNRLQNIASQFTKSKDNVLAKAGEGIKKLTGGINLQGGLKPQSLEGEKRAIGEETASTPVQSKLETSQSSVAKPLNDIRDQFFKSGEADKYSEYIDPGKIGLGALKTDLFKDQFYRTPDAIKGVFSKTNLLPEATNKFQDVAIGDIKSQFSSPDYSQADIKKAEEQVRSSGFDFKPEQVSVRNMRTMAEDLKEKLGSKFSEQWGDGMGHKYNQSDVQNLMSKIPDVLPDDWKMPEVSVRRFTPSISDYLRAGKTGEQYYAETGQQSFVDAVRSDVTRAFNALTGGVEVAKAHQAPASPHSSSNPYNDYGKQMSVGPTQGVTNAIRAAGKGYTYVAPSGNVIHNYTPANANMSDASTGLPVRGWEHARYYSRR